MTFGSPVDLSTGCPYGSDEVWRKRNGTQAVTYGF